MKVSVTMNLGRLGLVEIYLGVGGFRGLEVYGLPVLGIFAGRGGIMAMFLFAPLAYKAAHPKT